MFVNLVYEGYEVRFCYISLFNGFRKLFRLIDFKFWIVSIEYGLVCEYGEISFSGDEDVEEGKILWGNSIIGREVDCGVESCID